MMNLIITFKIYMSVNIDWFLLLSDLAELPIYTKKQPIRTLEPDKALRVRDPALTRLRFLTGLKRVGSGRIYGYSLRVLKSGSVTVFLSKPKFRFESEL